ncbi:L,D-transpeptidase family protein [Hespellia stercorisuis]|uniref:L,D-transpeptidase catalytic domain n=1 Tax=Hespellia stercorisuis DSM 15480 TaxID=1121950 RepID=A0A1M6UMY1_9FIRM|nr:L,D-transpeptidase family protein [Hespellia stercorisuis]SHK70584.1 L,D-transpeptidase catalytic domain [Hespellia stercorisuis DSM 15480]
MQKRNDNSSDFKFAGDFGVSTAFGIKENPGTVMPYVDVTENTYCCSDEHYYNQIIDISEHPHDCSNGEKMITYSPQYNYGMFLDYNKECVVGNGSAIFFHCFGAKPYTQGCVAVSEQDMITILKAVEPGVRVVIDHMPL